MQYTTIDNSSLRVSRLGFGTASLHHQFSRAKRRNILETALAGGITHFDTSPYYGYGIAESDLGALVSGRRSTVTIATKIGLYPKGWGARVSLDVWIRKAAGKIFSGISRPGIDWSIQRAENSLNASLRRLQCDYVDILFLHEPSPAAIRADEFINWLARQRALGKVRYWGLAGSPALYEAWLATNSPLCNIVQAQDSLEEKEADTVLKHGRKLQFTYGYLNNSYQSRRQNTAEEIIQGALHRNENGTVLFSSRRAERIALIARALD